MYAGHFAPVPLLHRYYPTISPYVLTFGVVYIDLVFGLLSYFGVEGFQLNPKAGALGVDINCNYSHSLIGSLILSAFYGVVTRSYLPGFMASFSHFAADWLVHNLDLPLFPFSSIIVGGLQLWSRFPLFAFIFELLVCIIMGSFGPNSTTNFYSVLFMVSLHLSQGCLFPDIFKSLFYKSKIDRQTHTFIRISYSYGVPAFLFGLLLVNRARKAKQSQHKKRRY